MTGLTRQRAAEAVAALFGTSARQTHESTTYDPWEVIDQDGKKWRFVYDGSIKATMRDGRRQIPATSGIYKVEMNSPKLSYEEMGKLQEVVRALRHAGAVVNSSCGMHVHVDASRHTPQSLKNALSIMYSKEDILFKALNVNEARVERWCQKVREPMLEKIRKLPTNISMERLKREWYSGIDGYPLLNFIVVIIDLLLGGPKFIVFGIYLCVDAATHPVLLCLLTTLSGRVDHIFSVSSLG